jgi:hypothetical protein
VHLGSTRYHEEIVDRTIDCRGDRYRGRHGCSVRATVSGADRATQPGRYDDAADDAVSNCAQRTDSDAGRHPVPGPASVACDGSDTSDPTITIARPVRCRQAPRHR